MKMQRRIRNRRRMRRGFSLMEILLVLVILSVVAGAVGFAIFAQQDRAYANFTKTEIATMKSALQTYRLNSGSYPSQLNALWERPSDAASSWSQTLDKAIVNDPWGQSYTYQLKGESFEIRSNGPDKQPNTEDDITN